MKNLSESVYHSSKWLQKFADFEFRTGEDIRGVEMINKFKEFIKESKEEITYVGPKDYYDVFCIEAYHSDELAGRVIFNISDDEVPYHEVMSVKKEFRGSQYKIALKLKLLAILVNKKSRYYTKDLSRSGLAFIEKYENDGIWKLSEYEMGKLITLTEKGKELSIKYGKELLNINIEYMY